MVFYILFILYNRVEIISNLASYWIILGCLSDRAQIFYRVLEFCLTNLHLKHHRLVPLSARILEYNIEKNLKFGRNENTYAYQFTRLVIVWQRELQWRNSHVRSN